MFDYKGIMANITGFAKTTFQMTKKQQGESTSERKPRRSAREILRRHLRMSSSEERTTIIAEEAREDGNYEADPEQPILEEPVQEMQKTVEVVEVQKKPEEKKKKRSRELNIPTRDLFASDFVLQPDEDLPGFSPIDSEYESDDEVFESEELSRIRISRYASSMPPPLMGLNPAIPNEYDPVIGIISVQGVRIPRSKPIDILPKKETRLPFFGARSDLHVMLITERMYDVFKENIRKNGKARMMNWMENLAMMISIQQMCGRLVPIELMDGVTYFYDYDTVSFLSKNELVALLLLCDNDEDAAKSAPSLFHQDSPEEVLERNVHFQRLMSHQKVYVRCVDYQAVNVDEIDFNFPFMENADNEHNKRMTLERQLKTDSVDHEEMGNLIRTISQDLEDAEFQQGFDYLHKSTLSLFDARVIVPPVN